MRPARVEVVEIRLIWQRNFHITPYATLKGFAILPPPFLAAISQLNSQFPASL